VLVRPSISQPFVASPSQSKKPVRHSEEHDPLEHSGREFGGAMHMVPQPPQLVGSFSWLTQVLLQRFGVRPVHPEVHM